MERPDEQAATAVPPSAGPLRRRQGPLRRAYAFLVSPKLAIAFLTAVLLCCLAGVTLMSPEKAWERIFTALWFNGLLVLLAVSSAAAFFSRIWRRRLTLVTVGLIVFHLSFLTLLGGAVVNDLFHFVGVMRLTEGETLPSGRLESYDRSRYGRFFDWGLLRGETTLVRVHRDLEVAGENKRVGYEIAVGDEGVRRSGIVYVTEHLDHRGFRYFRLKEGYSVLVALSDREGRELCGAHVPLQSHMQAGGNLTFVTGTATEALGFLFPQAPEHPIVELLVRFRPNTVVERTGDVFFRVRPVDPSGHLGAERTGTVAVGGRFDAGDFILEPREIRHWAGMEVRRDPGLTVILGSLCAGLLGMFLILVGRLRQGGEKKRAALAV